MRKKLVLFGLVAAIAVSVIALDFLYRNHQQTIEIGTHAFAATVLTGDEELRRGLSGTKQLPKDQVMVFQFNRDNTWPIWMKDMHIAIDIVWLDSERRVVTAIEQVKPDTYPEIFRPESDARYVLEFAAGAIDRTGLNLGDKVKFNL